MTQPTEHDGRVAKWVLLLTLLLMLLARVVAGAEGESNNGNQPPADELRPPAELYQLAKRASAEILVDGHFGGSGFFVDEEGLLLTAAHVIGRPGSRIEILSPQTGRIEAEVVAVDLGHDSVLLRVEPRDNGYAALPIAEKLPPPGDDVFLFGAPLFRHAVLLCGTIARDDLVYSYYTGRYNEVLHVACTVQSGMSGGPWVNRRGEVVALQSGVMSANAIPIGIAHAIPYTAIRDLLNERRNAATPTMGAAVEELWQHGRSLLDRFAPGTEGLVLRNVIKDGPAARAGLREWDAVVAADGQKIRLSGELLTVIRSKQPGDELKLTVVGPDGTGTRETTVRLGKLEVGWPDSP